MTHLLQWHELHHLLGVQTQDRGLVLVGSATWIQQFDTLSHQETLLHRRVKLHTHTHTHTQSLSEALLIKNISLNDSLTAVCAFVEYVNEYYCM